MCSNWFIICWNFINTEEELIWYRGQNKNKFENKIDYLFNLDNIALKKFIDKFPIPLIYVKGNKILKNLIVKILRKTN